MSKLSQALASATQAAQAAGGSHKTIEARTRTTGAVMRAAHERGQQVRSMDTLREKHVAAFVREQQAAGRSDRTLQTQLSHIRVSLRAVDRAGLADSPGLQCSAFQVNDASRDGTRAPATDDQVKQAHDAAAVHSNGLAAMVSLQSALGLRLNEAMTAGPSLDTWARAIEARQPITVVFGTKGGRVRDVRTYDPDKARQAVAEARRVATEHGGRLMPQANRKAAEAATRNAWHRHISPASGITSHQIRAGYARFAVDCHQADGLSRREALALVSCDLGHGDGRGRWVERVYLARA